ncbi:KUP/HAK/KT family potassium transporter [Mucilaginibacter sp.]|uniref:KUP/HAK/KT family potassium transporter n=1 Tax=Mucilaginibacter sp. TaxID=1882438 RepID=UPI003564B5C5
MDTRIKRLSAGGMLVALGIIFGDIGTSPLYVFQTLLEEGGRINQAFVLGSISCIFWTLTLQTTFKYVFITLQADNQGEGGIFSLYTIVRHHGNWLAIPAIIGAATMLADGIITPPISVTSAIEGLHLVNGLSKIITPGNHNVMLIVTGILFLLFFVQQFGTRRIGSAFGPVMLLWFLMLGTCGFCQLFRAPGIMKALNPYYGISLLIEHPRGVFLLGAVFLCTTGAEALYSDLGHCGKKNIQFSWLFVKASLLLNYLGQGAWVLLQPASKDFSNVSPFFQIVPHSVLLPAIILAMCATIIASQALITGSFTLINEAISLGFWPSIKIKYPTDIRGQVYIPAINWFLCAGCIAVMLHFRTSSAMTAAYGFSITIAMLMTTILMYYFMRDVKRWPHWIVILILSVFLCIEFSFFVANAIKLSKLLFFLLFELALIGIMYIWFRASRIKNKLLKYVNLNDQLSSLSDLSKDQDVAKFATHVVYLTRACINTKQIEQSIIYSILIRNPKRADVYWFIHVEKADEPYTMEYTISEVSMDKVIRIDFRLGFRVQPRINVLFRNVIENMVREGKLNISSRYPSLKKHHLMADFQFVILEKFLSNNNDLNTWEKFMLNCYFNLKKFAQTEQEAFGLDTSETKVEFLPLVFKPLKVHLTCVPEPNTAI